MIQEPRVLQVEAVLQIRADVIERASQRRHPRRCADRTSPPVPSAAARPAAFCSRKSHFAERPACARNGHVRRDQPRVPVHARRKYSSRLRRRSRAASATVAARPAHAGRRDRDRARQARRAWLSRSIRRGDTDARAARPRGCARSKSGENSSHARSADRSASWTGVPNGLPCAAGSISAALRGSLALRRDSRYVRSGRDTGRPMPSPCRAGCAADTPGDT